MNINDFRNFVLFIAKKAQSGANPTPSQFNLAVERGYFKFIMNRYGNPAEYLPGRPVSTIAWQQSYKISDDLDFLLTRLTFTLPSDGKLFRPDGSTIKDLNGIVAPKYLHFSSLRFEFTTNKNGDLTTKEVPIDVLKDSEIGDVLDSSIVNPTRRFPVCAFYDDHIQINPKDLQKVIFTYLRLPKIPKWAFNLVNGRPVYDADNSVDIEAPDQTINEIAFNTLSFLGISIRDQVLFQASEQYKAQGV